MKGLRQDKRGSTNSFVFTNADNTVGELSFDGGKFSFSDPVTFDTGQILLPDGTESSPSLGFSSTDAMGMYWNAANVIGFTTGGNTRVTITAGGAVKVGTILSLNGVEHTITGNRKSVTAGAATTVLTTADSGKVFNIKAVATAAYTLPTPAAGLHFKWIWSIDNTDAVTITTKTLTEDIFVGGLVVCAAAAVNTFVETAATSNTITMEDGAAVCGGGVGSWIEVICTEALTWFVRGIVNSNTDADNAGVGLFSHV